MYLSLLLTNILTLGTTDQNMSKQFLYVEWQIKKIKKPLKQLVILLQI